MKLTPVKSGTDLALSPEDAARPDGVEKGKALKKATKKEINRISDAQRVFYADARYALLIILQGRDAAGKDGTIRKVFSAVNPQGCTVTSFKAPTDTERAHDFLWRVHQAVPPRGMIGIFNRSQYEDILVPRVHEQIDEAEWKRRYRQINEFEKMLSEQHVIILKLMLHISPDEQKQRLNERLENKKKNWKFRRDDLDDRSRWGAFTDAYREMLHATSTKWAPWYVVPADSKKVRNWLIAQTIAETLEGLDLRYPKPASDIEGLEVI
ncbi:MAG TPA: PPK2 family polyphosphate kinase [Gemmatimonadaceae bacterium]|jgi:PPK2 family polyphosphate:nucleotide phosphotransferase